MLPERRCLECGDILHGRSDKKFCCDQCRNAYNNRQAGETYSSMRRINRILKKNFTVLSGYNKKGRATILREDLLTKEFNFAYFTHIVTSHNGRTYYYCYDQGYALIDGIRVILVKKQDKPRKLPPG